MWLSVIIGTYEQQCRRPMKFYVLSSKCETAKKCIYYCLLQPISYRFIKIRLSEETCCSLEWQVFTAVWSSGSEFHSTWKKLGIFKEKEKKLIQDKILLKSVCVVENEHWVVQRCSSIFQNQLYSSVLVQLFY